MWHAVLAFLSILALGFCLAMGVVGYASRKIKRHRRQTLLHSRRGLSPLWNTTPSLSVTPFDPNAETHKGGRIGYYTADAAINVRYSLVTIGASAGKTIKANLASSTPWGIAEDTTDTITNDLAIPLAVSLLSNASDRTQKVAVNSNVAVGDWLIPDTTNPIYGMTDPGLNLNRFGRAITAGVAGGTVEFAPCVPTRFASGSYTSQVSAEADAIPVAGLIVGDFVVVTLVAVGGAEKIVTAVAAAGQINIVTSANTTNGTTKYNYVVFRA
jgi:hypothetical protein